MRSAIVAAFVATAVASPAVQWTGAYPGESSTTCTDEVATSSPVWTTLSPPTTTAAPSTWAPVESSSTCTEEESSTWVASSSSWVASSSSPVAPVATSTWVPKATWTPKASSSAPWYPAGTSSKVYPTGSSAPKSPVGATGTSWVPKSSPTTSPYKGAGNALNAAGMLAGVGAVAALFL